jgi:two-component sensor histidine kinase
MDKNLVDTLMFFLSWLSLSWCMEPAHMSLTDELPPLADEDRSLLDKVVISLPIMADLSRSDLILYRALDADRAVVVAHAQPHSVSSVHAQNQKGQGLSRREFPLLSRVLAGQRDGGATTQGQPGESMQKEMLSVRNGAGVVIAALCIETTIVEVQRHHKRSPVFRSALRDLQQMLVRGEITGADSLTKFGEHDGILFVDSRRQIRYVSGVAENLYRKLGHAESLLRHTITGLGTNESAFFAAIEGGRCVESETHEGQLIWIRKAIPVRDTQVRLPLAAPDPSPWKGILLTVSDVTDSRRREQELLVKAAMIQEIHHRVKNNLQTIASLLRMQSRRVEDPAAHAIIDEAVGRILSVAVVHEFLSHDEGSVISIREVAQRIVNHTIQGILDPEKGIQLALRGGGFSLVAQQATACALVINELLQNAVEHGFADRSGGTIIVNLLAEDGNAVIEIADDGEGLPPDFDLDRSSSLGLRIVQTLVREDLKGTFELTDSTTNSRGVRAFVRFPRLPVPIED